MVGCLLLVFATRSSLPQAEAGIRAKHALDEGRYGEAEGIYRQLLRSSPDSAQLLADLGITLSVEGKSAGAAEAFEHALRVRYEPKTFALLAKSRCDSGQYAAVRPMMPKIVDEDKERPDLLGIVAACMLDAGDPVDAVAAYERLASDPGSVTDIVLVQLTRAYLASAQFFFVRLNAVPDKAPYVEALQAAREGKAENARGAYAHAAEQTKLFRPDASYPDAVKAWRSAPGEAALLYQLSVLSGEQSMSSFARCRSTYPASPYADQLTGEMLADQGRRDEAMAQYEQLLKVNPDLPGLRRDLGNLYIQEQNWTSALPIFQEQLKRYAEDRQAAARVSQCLLELERYDDLKRFLVPRSSAPQPPLWLRLDLATALEKLGDSAGATAQLVAGEREFPAEKSVHYRLMRMYAAAGNADGSAREAALFHSLK